MSRFEIRSVPRQDTAVIHRHCRPEAISATMGEAFAAIFAFVQRAGATATGPVFSRYFEFGADAIDFESGVAVAAPIAGDGEVQPGELGGGEAVVGIHVGPYDTLHETYGAMQAWMADQGRAPSSVMWEVYLTDPDEEPDPSKWQTEIYWPVS
jgi:effector-binding domain-containing protein